MNKPAILIRRFKSIIEADSFLKGEISIGLLSYYREIEGKRKDETEGNASFSMVGKTPTILIDKVSGAVIKKSESLSLVNHKYSFFNPIYIISTSEIKASEKNMDVNFGKYRIIINNPEELRLRLENVWKSHPLFSEGKVSLDSVIYNKGEIIDPSIGFIEQVSYDYRQKPACHADESEWRYIFITKYLTDFNYQNHIVINVGSLNDICQIKIA
jgi:hypothetical protein